MTGRRSNTWALVLAAGDGRRHESLVTACGGPAVPKQYCSLRPGPSLLHDALTRALALTTQQRICVVVAQKHRCWWTPELRRLSRDNVVVRPENPGAGVGILLLVLHILERDPCARIVILPADHHVWSESTLVRSLRAALDNIDLNGARMLLLGVTPEAAATGLGYIVPGAAEDDVAVLGRARRTLYARLQKLDFSKDVLAGQESSIRVVRVPPCGWSDLGTPERAARAVAQLSSEHAPIGIQTRLSDISRSPLSLAEQHARRSSEAR